VCERDEGEMEDMMQDARRRRSDRVVGLMGNGKDACEGDKWAKFGGRSASDVPDGEWSHGEQ